MNFKAHLYASLLALFVITLALWRLGVPTALKPYLDVYALVSIPIIFIVYSLLPDIDTESYIENYFYGTVILVVLAIALTGRYVAAIGVSILSLVPKLGGHRQFTHAWWFGVVVSLPLAWFSPLYAMAAFGGFAVHKICDL